MNGLDAEDQTMSRSVGLLISILVRYPELGTINYEPHHKTLKFTFLLTKLLTEREFSHWERMLTLSLDTYWYIQKRRARVFETHRSAFGKITVLEIVRDIDTLTREEISLVIELVRAEFGQLLVIDAEESLLEEDMVLQEELIQQMLEDFKLSRQDKNLIAFREEGRVLVFNK